jgi:peptidoglycan hydrolase CwlO-like protein
MVIILELAILALLVLGLCFLLMRAHDTIMGVGRKLWHYLSKRLSYRGPLHEPDATPGSDHLSPATLKRCLHDVLKKRNHFEKALESVESPFVNTREVVTDVNHLVDTMRQRIERAQRISRHIDLSDKAVTDLRDEIAQLHSEIRNTQDRIAMDSKIVAANHKATQLRTLSEIKTVSQRLRADLIRLDAFIDDIQTRVLGMDFLGRKESEIKEIKDLFERINNDIAVAENIEEEFYRDVYASTGSDNVESPLYLQYRDYWDRGAAHRE